MNVHPPAAAEAAPLMSELRVSIVGALLVLIGPLSMTLFTPAMPEMVRTFGTNEAVVTLTLSLYFAGFALAQLICGPLSDGFGRKPVIYAFLGIYLAASLMAFFSPTIEMLIGSRFLQGVGAAVGIAISRAIVRDLFTGERSARIMNMISLILGIGPALAPTLGGLTMEFFGWRAIFVIMLALAVLVILVTRIILVETGEPDLSRIRPRALLGAYGSLLGNGYFMTTGLVLAGTLGAFYTQAVLLPFVLIDRAGLTPTQFGLGMIMQTGSFFIGSLIVRRLTRHHGAYRIMPVGIGFLSVGSIALAVLMRVAEPTLLTVIGPIAFYAFGTAFIMPGILTASLAPFPHMAGTAAAMGGFLQMAGGLVGSAIAAAIGDPVVAMATVVPLMGVLAVISWWVWRKMPQPAIPKTMLPRDIEQQIP